MRKGLIALAAILLSLALHSPALAQERGLVVPAGQRVDGNIATTTQNIEVAGEVSGDVTSWSGDVVVTGRVGGDVVSYSGHVTVAATGRVGGHVLALSGGLLREPGAAVAGQALGGPAQVSALASLFDLMMPAPGPAGDTAIVGRLLFGLALGVFLLALCLLCIAFWPGRTAIASLTLRQMPLRAVALGLISTLLLGLLLPPLAVLLAASLLGLPLLLLLLVLALAPYVYGMAALALLPGRAARPGGVSRPTILLSTAIVALVALLALAAPLWGLALFFLVASPGLGAAILSRGGLAAPAGAAPPA